MYKCPNCNSSTITWWKKLNATSVFPAKCKQCRGLSYVSAWKHTAVYLIYEASFWGFIILALIMQSWLILALIPMIIVLCSVAIYKFSKLNPIDEIGVAASKRETYLLLFIAFLILSVGGIIFGT